MRSFLALFSFQVGSSFVTLKSPLTITSGLFVHGEQNEQSNHD